MWTDPDALEVALGSGDVLGPLAGVVFLVAFIGVCAKWLRFAGRDV